MTSKVDLTVNLGGIQMKNPVTTASGTFNFGKEYSTYLDLNSLGAIVVKGITLYPKEGNPPPRLVETPAGLLNAIGLQNPGVAHFLKDDLPYLKQYDLPVIVNISGNTVEEYVELAERLDEDQGIAGIEVNISCPNVKKGGLAFGTKPSTSAEVTRAIREVTKLPLIVKLSPNVTDITEIARSVEDAGADALSLINTLLGMAIDLKCRKPKLGNVVGGLSGPAVKPVALRMVWQVSRAVKIPLLGMGGIMNAEDALEFILAGASAVAVGTANFLNPKACVEIIQGIEDYLAKQRINSLKELIGGLEV